MSSSSDDNKRMPGDDVDLRLSCGFIRAHLLQKTLVTIKEACRKCKKRRIPSGLRPLFLSLSRQARRFHFFDFALLSPER